MLVLSADEILKRLLGVFLSTGQLFHLIGYFEVIPTNVLIQVFSSQYPHYPYQLVVVILALEKGINFEDHSRHGAAQGPNV